MFFLGLLACDPPTDEPFPEPDTFALGAVGAAAGTSDGEREAARWSIGEAAQMLNDPRASRRAYASWVLIREHVDAEGLLIGLLEDPATLYCERGCIVEPCTMGDVAEMIVTTPTLDLDALRHVAATGPDVVRGQAAELVDDLEHAPSLDELLRGVEAGTTGAKTVRLE